MQQRACTHLCDERKRGARRAKTRYERRDVSKCVSWLLDWRAGITDHILE